MKVLKLLKSNKGMTLTELMVGIAILSILMMTVSTVFMQMSRLQQRTLDMSEINSLVDNVANPMVSDLLSTNTVPMLDPATNVMTVHVSGFPMRYRISLGCEPACTCHDVCGLVGCDCGAQSCDLTCGVAPCDLTGICGYEACNTACGTDPCDVLVCLFFPCPQVSGSLCGYQSCDSSCGFQACVGSAGGCNGNPCNGDCGKIGDTCPPPGILLQNGNPVLAKSFYKQRNVNFQLSCAFCGEAPAPPPVTCVCPNGTEKAYILAVILIQDSNGEEITRRNYTVRPLMLNQYF